MQTWNDSTAESVVPMTMYLAYLWFRHTSKQRKSDVQQRMFPHETLQIAGELQSGFKRWRAIGFIKSKVELCFVKRQTNQKNQKALRSHDCHRLKTIEKLRSRIGFIIWLEIVYQTIKASTSRLFVPLTRIINSSCNKHYERHANPWTRCAFELLTIRRDPFKHER